MVSLGDSFFPLGKSGLRTELKTSPSAVLFLLESLFLPRSFKVILVAVPPPPLICFNRFSQTHFSVDKGGRRRFSSPPALLDRPSLSLVVLIIAQEVFLFSFC